MEQCLTCGEGKGSAFPQNAQTLASPSWDEALLERYEIERTAQFAAINAKYIDLAVAEELQRAKDVKQYRQDYEGYRRTETWQRKRALVMKRAGGVCEGCLLCAAEIVHHRTYQNLGDELLFELVALCHQCHDKAHPEHHESFYDVDYSPCNDCRMGESNGHCGRFDTLRYLAFSPGGGCGPRFDGFEGLK
ncbi:MAG: hypothetical protein V4586_10415 [Pseudomonadota bacterium]